MHNILVMLIPFLQAVMAAGLLLFPIISVTLLIGVLLFTTVIYRYLAASQAAVDSDKSTPIISKQVKFTKHTGIFLLSFAIATGIVIIISLFCGMFLGGFIPGLD